MRLLKSILLCLLAAFPGLIEGQSTVTVPQLNVSGNVGCIGFPCVNTGTVRIPSDADYNMPSTLSQPFTSASSVKFTSAVSLTAPRNIIYPAGRFPIDVENATSGGQVINICGPSGACSAIPNDSTHFTRIWNDGTNYVSINTAGGGCLSGCTFTSSTYNGVNLQSDGSSTAYLNAAGGYTSIGTGAYSLGGAVSCSNVTLGPGAGTSPTCSAVVGLDGSHVIDITTGSSPAAGSLFYTFTFTASRGHNSYCVISPISFGEYTSLNQIPGFSSTGTATYYQLNSGATALVAGTVYEFNVSCP